MQGKWDNCRRWQKKCLTKVFKSAVKTETRNYVGWAQVTCSLFWVTVITVFGLSPKFLTMDWSRTNSSVSYISQGSWLYGHCWFFPLQGPYFVKAGIFQPSLHWRWIRIISTNNGGLITLPPKLLWKQDSWSVGVGSEVCWGAAQNVFSVIVRNVWEEENVSCFGYCYMKQPWSSNSYL